MLAAHQFQRSLEAVDVNQVAVRRTVGGDTRGTAWRIQDDNSRSIRHSSYPFGQRPLPYVPLNYRSTLPGQQDAQIVRRRTLSGCKEAGRSNAQGRQGAKKKRKEATTPEPRPQRKSPQARRGHSPALVAQRSCDRPIKYRPRMTPKKNQSETTVYEAGHSQAAPTRCRWHPASCWAIRSGSPLVFLAG
jgi:hypothetical protein